MRAAGVRAQPLAHVERGCVERGGKRRQAGRPPSAQPAQRRCSCRYVSLPAVRWAPGHARRAGRRAGAARPSGPRYWPNAAAPLPVSVKIAVSAERARAAPSASQAASASARDARGIGDAKPRAAADPARLSRTAVTMARLPPPPRSAQNRSGSCARRCAAAPVGGDDVEARHAVERQAPSPARPGPRRRRARARRPRRSDTSRPGTVGAVRWPGGVDFPRPRRRPERDGAAGVQRDPVQVAEVDHDGAGGWSSCRCSRGRRSGPRAGR